MYLTLQKAKKERIGRILQMHANNRKEIEVVYSGDIAAAVGLKDTTTGDTLCDENHPIVLESMEFPDPVISVAVEPKTKADQEKMGIALQKLAEEDPTFRVRTDAETGQTIISGMGELHLDIIVDRMSREFKVDCKVGKPQVAYRETIRKTVKSEGKFVRQSGGKVSMVIAGLNSFHKIQVKVSPSKAKSLVVLFLKNTSDQSKMVSKKLWKTGLLLVIQWLISKLSFMMVLIMKLTPQKWPSKLQVLWHSKLVL